MQITSLFKGKPAASSPRQFSLEDWKVALLAAKNAIASKRLGILAAGIAYFATLAVFPLLAAAIAIASFIISSDQIQSVATAVEGFLPTDIATLINAQLRTALENKAANTIIAVIAISLALFSVSGAVQNTISASNASYDVDESRGFFKLRLTSLAVLALFFISGLIIIGLLLMNVETLRSIGLPLVVVYGLSTVRWIILPVVLSTALATFYRYGPNRKNPKWQWVSWGSVIAGFGWFIITVAFFVYARFFAHFSESYGAFAGLIVLMTWLNLSAFAILLGAEVNYRLENQTASKTSK